MGLSPNGIVKTRRSHRKSRNGCSECKRRHIRCDERRPNCTNCAIAERACSFPPSTTAPRSPATDSSGHSHEPISSTSSPDNPYPTPSSTDHLQPFSLAPRVVVASALTLPSFTESLRNSSSADYHPPAPLASLFTARHLILLHHAFASIASDGVIAQDHIQPVLDIAIRDSIDAPYLIDQLLALSALHLAVRTDSRLDPSPAGTPASLRHQATELQTRAVSSFTRLTAGLPADHKPSCVPRFLFASLLSLQVLAETLHQHRRHPEDDDDDDQSRPQTSHPHPHRNPSFALFITRMVECMHLHRGMLSVVRPTWNYLLQSELYPLLRISNDAANTANVKLSQGTECLPLEQLIKTTAASNGTTVAPLDDAAAAACLGCIERLQWALDMQNSLPFQDVPHAASSFIVTIPAEFADVLGTLRPEALIILAYFGVLLHRCRRFWAFENVGANMIRAIAGHLGDQWHDALLWPLDVIETEND